MIRSYSLPIYERSQVGEARRLITHFAQTLSLCEVELSKIAIVITELANNLIKHAKKGELVWRSIHLSDGSKGLEVLSLDQGPGMMNVAECLRDGYSTAGSSGIGMGAIQRFSNLFEIHSAPGLGTAILTQHWSSSYERLPGKLRPLAIGAVCLPYPGEIACGDSWAFHADETRNLFIVADGLGHGLKAAEASQEAVATFNKSNTLEPSEILSHIHQNLKTTRGAAAAITELDLSRRKVSFSSIGNTSGVIVPFGLSRTKAMVSQNGTLGAEVRKIQKFEYPFESGSLLVLHSDGLISHWDLSRYAGLVSRHPGLIAGILYRDYKRDKDDVTVVVAKEVIE